MPKQDGTGPQGMGPNTGWGLGPCARGLKLDFGRGFGRCWRLDSLIPSQDEKQILENQAKSLEEGLKIVKTRLAEFNTQK